ncbi:endoplasmic reticulum-Golgi intermediate compartment protein 1 isoform 3-T7 [Sylvia borin]
MQESGTNDCRNLDSSRAVQHKSSHKRVGKPPSDELQVIRALLGTFPPSTCEKALPEERKHFRKSLQDLPSSATSKAGYLESPAMDTSPRLKFPNANQDLNDYSCAVTWAELPCFCHCQLCCETASLFLLLCHISPQALDRAELGGESCTFLMTRALSQRQKHEERRSALHHTDPKYSLAPAHCWTFFHVHMDEPQCLELAPVRKSNQDAAGSSWKRVNELYVDDPDKDSGGKIEVNLNISLPNLHCELVGLDIQDEMGRHEVGHIDNSMKIPLNNGDGCRFEGHFSINKVHNVHGAFNALEGADKLSSNPLASHDYILKIVPTVYEDMSGKQRYSYQYTVANKEYVAYSHTGRIIPAIWFRYDLSPITVKYTERRQPLYRFITSICAIIGGTFTVAGILDSCIFTASEAWKKIQLGKMQ